MLFLQKKEAGRSNKKENVIYFLFAQFLSFGSYVFLSILVAPIISKDMFYAFLQILCFTLTLHFSSRYILLSFLLYEGGVLTMDL